MKARPVGGMRSLLINRRRVRGRYSRKFRRSVQPNISPLHPVHHMVWWTRRESVLSINQGESHVDRNCCLRLLRCSHRWALVCPRLRSGGAPSGHSRRGIARHGEDITSPPYKDFEVILLETDKSKSFREMLLNKSPMLRF